MFRPSRRRNPTHLCNMSMTCIICIKKKFKNRYIYRNVIKRFLRISIFFFIMTLTCTNFVFSKLIYFSINFWRVCFVCACANYSCIRALNVLASTFLPSADLDTVNGGRPSLTAGDRPYRPPSPHTTCTEQKT